jgi:hypothetical protein
VIFAALYFGGLASGFVLVRLLEAREVRCILVERYVPRGKHHFTGVRVPRFMPKRIK